MASPAILVDFDGTASSVDVAEALLKRFGRPGWRELDIAVERGESTLASAIDGQASMLEATRQEMLDYVLSSHAVAPDFVDFCAWAESHGHEVAVVSDGFGIYVRPMLQAAGLGRLQVMTNQLARKASGWGLEHPSSHPVCIGCGTCKMLAVTARQDAKDRVAFVGNGISDRFASFYADVVFAKDKLAEICLKEGIEFCSWQTFDDVRRTLEALPAAPAAKQVPAQCPGWTPRGMTVS
jgi:2-hydroxy-3-keto-5-methylthiopentenyl-1-phosphate phosphatase